MAASPVFIKNPLTIIGIFASLVEVMGLAILPRINENIQLIYIWFLMLFPTALVAAFFVVLYKKHVVLYAPSDYQSDNTFVDMGRNFLPASDGQIRRKKEEEIAEMVIEERVAGAMTENTKISSPARLEEEANIVHSNSSEIGGEPTEENGITSSGDRTKNGYSRAMRSALAENWAISALSEETALSFKREMAFVVGKREVIFDAVNLTSVDCTIIEVRLTKSGLLNDQTISRYLSRVNLAYEHLTSGQKGRFQFIFAMVDDADNEADRSRIYRSRAKIIKLSADYPFRTTVRIFSWLELETRYVCA